MIRKRILRHHYRKTKNRLFAEFCSAINSKQVNRFKVPMYGLKTKIYINPNKIAKKLIDAQYFNKSQYLFLEGNWDLNVRNFDDFEKNDLRYRTCRELLDGCDITQTTEYEFYRKKLKNKISKRNFQNEKDIIVYLEHLNEMYHEIMVHGTLDEEKMIDPIAGSINICVDREGRIILLANGNHRIAAARYLNISAVPVIVYTIHSQLLENILKTGRHRDIIGKINGFIKTIEVMNY